MEHTDIKLRARKRKIKIEPVHPVDQERDQPPDPVRVRRKRKKIVINIDAEPSATEDAPATSTDTPQQQQQQQQVISYAPVRNTNSRATLEMLDKTSEDSDSAVEAERRMDKGQRQRERKAVEKRKQKKKDKTDIPVDASMFPRDDAVQRISTPDAVLDSKALPFDSYISADDFDAVRSSVAASVAVEAESRGGGGGGTAAAIGDSHQGLERLAPGEKIFFQASYSALLEHQPPADPKERAQRVAKDPYSFAYIQRLLTLLPRDMSQIDVTARRAELRTRLHTNTRQHEEAYMCEPTDLEKPCANANQCVGLRLAGVHERSRFVLKAFLFFNEHEHYEQHMQLPSEVQSGKRLCILCLRNQVNQYYAMIRAYGSETEFYNPSMAISRFRNLVDLPGEYRLEDCIVSSSDKACSLMEPVVMFKLCDYDLQTIDGKKCLRQKLDKPPPEYASRDTNEDAIYANQMVRV
jgi:hypothetical protein